MPDEPTMWELKRAIESGYRELSGDIAQIDQRLSMYVLKEVYDVQRSADGQRIENLESQIKDQREQIRKAMWTAISSFIAPVVVAVVLAVMLRGG